MAILHHLTIYIYDYIHSYIIYVYIQLNIIILYHIMCGLMEVSAIENLGIEMQSGFDAQLGKSNGTWEQLELL